MTGLTADTPRNCFRPEAILQTFRRFCLTLALLLSSVAADAIPALIPPPNSTILENCGWTNLNLTVGETSAPIWTVIVSARSSNPGVVSNTNLLVNGSGASRAIRLKPSLNVSGTTTITLVADNGSAKTTNSFVLTVQFVNQPPVLGTLSALTLLENARATNRVVTVTDVDTPLAIVTVKAISENTNLLTAAITGSSISRILKLTPVTNAYGSTKITLVANDGLNAVTNSFPVTIDFVNQAPFLFPLTNMTLLENSSAAARIVKVTDPDTEITNVTVSATSSNTNVVTVDITGSGTNRTLTIRPVTNAFGTSTIRVVADDGERRSTNSFGVTVTAVNQAPGFTLLLDSVTVAEDAGLVTLSNVAANIFSGPPNESRQTNRFILTPASSGFFAIQPKLSGAGTLTFAVATNVNGTNTISILLKDTGGTNNGGSDSAAPKLFTVIVTPNNDPPYIRPLTNWMISEDSGPNNRPFVVTDIDSPITNVLVTALTSDANIASVSLSGTGTNRVLTVVPTTNTTGAVTVTLIADDGQNTCTNSFLLTVRPVNHAPSFVLSTNVVTVVEGTGPTLIENFAGDIRSGPDHELWQTNNFVVSVTNPSFFSSLPAISPTGTLTFTTASNRWGTNTITVKLRDNGGTALGGVDTSAAQTFRIVTTFVNDPPVLSPLPDLTVNEETRFTKSIVVTDIDTPLTNVFVRASSSDTNLVALTVSGTGSTRTLGLTTLSNVFGTCTITVVADDGAATVTNSFVLTVVRVDHAPVLGVVPTVTILENSGPTDIALLVTDIDTEIGDVSVQAISANTNLITVSIAGNETNRTLTIVPVTNAVGRTTIQLIADDTEKARTNSMVVTVTTVNNPPTFTLTSNTVSVLEDTGLVTIPLFATNIVAGPSNESSQTVSFTLAPTTTNSSFFAIQPRISPVGTLTFAAATNASGTQTISVVLKDSGGTNVGGVDSSTATFTLEVLSLNDPPRIYSLTNMTIVEDASTVTRSIRISDPDEDISVVSLTATSSDPGLATLFVSGTGTNRTLSITPAANGNGVATITLVADDGIETATNSFLLTVLPVNDPPEFTLASTNVTITRYSSLVTIPDFATNISPGGRDETSQSLSFLVTPGNSRSFVVQPSITADGTLTFRVSDVPGVATVSVRLRDNGSSSQGNVNSSAPQVFTVTVPPNPFVHLAGEYNGLFYDPNGVEMASAGFMRLILLTNGTYSGYVVWNASSNAFNGQFDLSGVGTNAIATSEGDLALNLQLDLDPDGTESAIGTIVNGNSWSALLQVDRATFDATQNPAPFAGRYNIVFPGSGGADVDAVGSPAGHGYGSVSVAADGILSFDGLLSDGTSVSQQVSLSKEGIWPLYIPLSKGLLLGWINFISTSTNDLSGTVSWIKDSTAAGTPFPGGFTNDVVVTGSTYSEPVIGFPILDMTFGAITFTGGDLTAPVTNTFLMNVNSTVTIDPVPADGLTLMFDLVSGTFMGQFVDTVNGGTHTFHGVVLQSGAEAMGYFLDGDQSGAVLIR